MMAASTLEENSRHLPVLIDTHVHLHQCFEAEQVFSIASQNFARYASRLGYSKNHVACLLLTEMRDESWFLNHQSLVKSHTGLLPLKSGWTLKATSENESLLAVNDTNDAQLAVIAGRQIVTEENLEVLALITSTVIPDGLSLAETVDAVANVGGIPVLPWGVGKWFGRRGKVILNFLQHFDDPKVFLGDNSGRPIGWPRPKYFQLMEQKGVPVLPGTDPLPLPNEVSKIGGFGLHVMADFNQHRPGDSVRRILNSATPSAETFGQLESPWHFLKNQITLRLH